MCSVRKQCLSVFLRMESQSQGKAVRGELVPSATHLRILLSKPKDNHFDCRQTKYCNLNLLIPVNKRSFYLQFYSSHTIQVIYFNLLFLNKHVSRPKVKLIAFRVKFLDSCDFKRTSDVI